MPISRSTNCGTGARNFLGLRRGLSRALCACAVVLAVAASPASGGTDGASTIVLRIPAPPVEARDSALANLIPVSGFRHSSVSGSCDVLTVTRPFDQSSGLFAAGAGVRQSFPEIELLVRTEGAEREALRVVYHNLSVAHVEIISGPDGAVEKIEFAPAPNATAEIHRSGTPYPGETITRIEMSCMAQSGKARLAQITNRLPQRPVWRPGW